MIRKRKSPEVDDETDNSTEGKLVNARLQAYLEEFDLEVANRSRALRAQAQDEAAMIRRELDIQLMKIPKRARSLTVNEFVADFSGNLLLASAVKPTPSNILVDNSSSTVTTTNNVSVVAATPARTAKFALVAATPLSERCVAKQRELALLAAKRRAPLSIQDINFALKTTSGASLDLTTINQNKAAKDSAREQIRRLQDQLAGLMSNLSSPP